MNRAAGIVRECFKSIDVLLRSLDMENVHLSKAMEEK